MRLAVFASGGGSNFGAVLDAIAGGRLAAEVVLLVADRPGIGALDRAAAAGVPTAVLPPADFPGAEAFGDALLGALDARGRTSSCWPATSRRCPRRSWRASGTGC